MHEHKKNRVTGLMVTNQWLKGVMKTHWRKYLFSLAVVSPNAPELVCPVIFKWPGFMKQ